MGNSSYHRNKKGKISYVVKSTEISDFGLSISSIDVNKLIKLKIKAKGKRLLVVIVFQYRSTLATLQC